MRCDVRLFEEAQLEEILKGALTVLRRTPFRVQGTDEFLDHLTSYGCEVDGELVRFPQRVIDTVMARCAEERGRWKGSGRERDIAPEITVFTHGQALHICDPECNRLRPATEEDLARWCHVVDAMGIISRSHPTFTPTDAPVQTADLHAFVTILLNSGRPHPVSVYSARMLPFLIQACRIVKGSSEAVKEDPVFFTKAWVTSPFMLDKGNLEVGMEARRLLGVPLTFGHMPVAGASAPVTVPGALVQNTAESLALSAMRLAVEDLPQPVAGCQAIMDMRHGVSRQMGPDMIVHRLAGQEMDDYLYRGEIMSGSRGWGWCGAGAATVSVQSVCEKALGVAFGVATGARAFGVGCLAFSDVGSPVQLVIDCELVQFFQDLFRDVPVDDDHIGVETILETAPKGGKYLESLHTAQFFREACWLPKLLDFRTSMAWDREPSDMIARAREQARDLYARSENRSPLSDVQRGALRQLVRDADASVQG